MALPLIAGIGGPLIAGGLSLLGGADQRSWAAAQSDKQMAFQERMSGSAYQRAVQDMKLAGINPMLAYMQGGASSPAGAMASGSDIISPAVSSAMSAMRLMQELKIMQAQAENIKTDTGKKFAEAQLSQQEWLANQMDAVEDMDPSPFRNSLLVALKRAQLNVATANASLARWNARTVAAELPGAKVSGSGGAALAKLVFQALGAGAGVTGAGAALTGAAKMLPRRR